MGTSLGLGGGGGNEMTGWVFVCRYGTFRNFIGVCSIENQCEDLSVVYVGMLNLCDLCWKRDTFSPVECTVICC